jgi:GNAT superfamily N-acetyltransferase
MPTHADSTERKVVVLPGQETVLACWSALAQRSPGAGLIRSSEAAVAVFPTTTFLNNAILLAPRRDATAVASQLADIYLASGIDAWALWLPSGATDLDAPDNAREVGELKRDITTLVMQATVSHGLRFDDGVVATSIGSVTRVVVGGPLPAIHLEPAQRTSGVSGWVMVQNGVAVAGAYTFLHGHDCGIYAVGTAPEWRRRGLARRLVEHAMADAARRGARTVSLQSTRMGQVLYESLGFEPAGRYEEWISP